MIENKNKKHDGPVIVSRLTLRVLLFCVPMYGIVIFREEEPDEGAAGMKSIDSFMVRPKKKVRANLFVRRGLELVDTF